MKHPLSKVSLAIFAIFGNFTVYSDLHQGGDNNIEASSIFHLSKKESNTVREWGLGINHAYACSTSDPNCGCAAMECDSVYHKTEEDSWPLDPPEPPSSVDVQADGSQGVQESPTAYENGEKELPTEQVKEALDKLDQLDKIFKAALKKSGLSTSETAAIKEKLSSLAIVKEDIIGSLSYTGGAANALLELHEGKDYEAWRDAAQLIAGLATGVALTAFAPEAIIGTLISSTITSDFVGRLADLLKNDFPSFVKDIDETLNIASEAVSSYNSANSDPAVAHEVACRVAGVPCYIPPIILDLDGNGISLSSLKDSTVWFDFNDDGIKEHISWVSGKDGILVYDANESGVVDSANEVILADYSHSVGGTDLDGLKALDANHDGYINSKDSNYGKFYVWVDKNENGISEPGELRSLSSEGIEISLKSIPANRLVNGNILSKYIRFRKKIIKGNGSAFYKYGFAADVLLKAN
ncbi:hypothetical protein [Gallaecimonas sp. GXIMD1310]|uniref:hypothetical protein n=1 Tax=Gallaecimonas sp. GXIMD1310 TaxID=3131926 RepID=UPI0032513E21